MTFFYCFIYFKITTLQRSYNVILWLQKNNLNLTIRDSFSISYVKVILKVTTLQCSVDVILWLQKN